MEIDLAAVSRQVRRGVLESTTTAGSGHPSSCLSAVELMVGLMFSGIFRYKTADPAFANNDRVIFSKGHAAPLLYSLWAAAGGIPAKELLTLRQFGSRLQGHPTREFPFTEVTTGSLGQGLSVGLGMAMAGKMDGLTFRTYVLLGDSEMAEGQIWEAMALAAYYKIDSLTAIVDINRLGQRGETLHGYEIGYWERKCRSFGWQTIVVDGHNLPEIVNAYQAAVFVKNKPTVILAKTVKGKGVSRIENKNGFHGKVLDKTDYEAFVSTQQASSFLTVRLAEPDRLQPRAGEFFSERELVETDTQADYDRDLSTRQAYGHALIEMAERFPEMVVLDAEVSNSTFAEAFKVAYPHRFLEMFIAEQNMVSVGLGLALRGKKPFISTFAAFFARAFDQIRLAAYSNARMVLVGSHAGVSLGQDGATQMGLEDIALFRSVFGSAVLYPADHISQEKLAVLAAEFPGICYMRTSRPDVKPLYEIDTLFRIGGSSVLRQSLQDKVTLIAAGVTLHESLAAADQLAELNGIYCRVIDLYSVKPIDAPTLIQAARQTQALIVIEDHYSEGGMAEAVRSALLYEKTPIYSMAVTKLPQSGTTAELLRYQGIDAQAIIQKVTSLLL